MNAPLLETLLLLDRIWHLAFWLVEERLSLVKQRSIEESEFMMTTAHRLQRMNMKAKLLLGLLVLLILSLVASVAVYAGGGDPSPPAIIETINPMPPGCLLRDVDDPRQRQLELLGQGFAKADNNINLQFRRADTGEESIHFHNEVDWDSDTRIVLDIASIKQHLWSDWRVPLTVRLTTYNEGGYVSISDWSSEFIYAQNATACLPPDEIILKVYILNFNPLIDDTPLFQYQGWNAPEALMTDYIAEVLEVSGSTVKHQVARHLIIPDYPPKPNGFVFSNEQYQQCLNNRDSAEYCRPIVDYQTILNTCYHPDYPSACEAIATGEADEIWLWGGPLFEYLEWKLIEPDTLCEGMDKPFFVMGFNYERGVVEMLHDLGHRAEAVLQTELGLVWDQFNGQRHRYEQRQSLACPASPGQLEVDPDNTHCGAVHYPPNSFCDYQYSRHLSVLSDCDDWALNYPHLTGQKSTINADTWGSDQRGYLKWWFSHFPNRPGTHNGRHNNWWKYVFLQPGPAEVIKPEITLLTELAGYEGDSSPVNRGKQAGLFIILYLLWALLVAGVGIVLVSFSFLKFLWN
jgi:hypothetical protein